MRSWALACRLKGWDQNSREANENRRGLGRREIKYLVHGKGFGNHEGRII